MHGRSDASTRGLRFLDGGGEMGALMRAHDWSETPLGPPEAWPGPLKTAIRLILNTGHPMYIWWGPDLLCFYNDAYRRTLGPERHPGSLGRPGREVWAEIWHLIGHQVDFVMAGHGSTWDENRPVPITRFGRLEEIYWTYSYSPIDDETALNGIGGVLVVCTETTEAVLAERRRAAETKRQRRIFEQAPGFIAILSGPEHVFEFTNAAFRSLFGNRGYVGKTAREAFPELAGQGFYELLDQVYTTGERYLAKRSAIRLESPGAPPEERFLDFIYEPVTDEAGRVTGIFAEGYDVTDAHRAEAGLRESEARLAFLDRLGAETAPLADADAVLATTTRLLGEHLNLSVCAYADMDEDQNGFTIRGDWAARGSRSIVGHYRLADFGKLAVKNLSAGLPLVVKDNLRELAAEEAATFQSIGIAATICMPLVKDGRLTALMAIHDRAPRVWTEAELNLLREVTARSWAHVERVAATAELRASEARYRTLFETVDAGFCVVELLFDDEHRPLDYRFVEANPAFERQTGLVGAVGRTARELVPDLEPHWFELYGRVALTGEPVRFENGSDAMGRWFDVHALRVGDPQLRRVAILFNDISERRRAEERLRELNEQLEQHVAARTAERNRVWEMSRDLFAIMGFDGHLKAINPAWETTLGRDRDTLMALSFREQVHPGDHAAVMAMMERLLRGETVTRFEDRLRHADGSWRWISWTLVPDGEVFYAVGRDVTVEKERQAELESAQEALRQSQKMEAMGQLTGGVAHDFNNLLTPIIGSLDMLVRRGVGSERERRLIDGALQSAERAKTLVQRLLAFARRQPLQPIAVDVGALVDSMAGLIGSTLGPQIEVRLELEPDLPPAQADPNQLEMALLNLAVNARDAMPDGGVLTVRAARGSVQDRHSGLKEGHYVRLSVADTGVGMDEVTRSRAVEPFFSTKGIGKGTGLGLSMVHGLTAQLGGRLAIESAPGQGTIVELWLPVSHDPVEADGLSSSAPRPRTTRGRALLVDDEDLVRMSTADMLMDLGYEVVEVGSAEEALRLVDEGLAPDLLVTDHLMPGMNGAELARRVRTRRPGLPVLVVSGYAQVDGIAPDLPRLTKPFRNAELAASLAAVMPSDAA